MTYAKDRDWSCNCWVSTIHFSSREDALEHGKKLKHDETCRSFYKEHCKESGHPVSWICSVPEYKKPAGEPQMEFLDDLLCEEV